MSNQRSCILFIALVVILLYLYYESIQKKEHDKTREKLLNENFSTYKMLKDKPKVLFGRQLLSYSTENATEDSSQKEISSHSTKFFQFRTLNTFPDTDHKNKVKRIKRNARIRKSIYKWKFNISLSKLDDEFTKSTDNHKNSVNENKGDEESLNVEIFIDGKTKQFKNLEHSWHVVKESLRNFYKEPNEPQSALNFPDFSSLTSQENIEESTKSSKDFFSLSVQNSSENLVREETKKVSSRVREAKFLFLDFGGGGNKENPPILPENGENKVNKVTPTESMHDLSFFNSTEQFDIKIVNGGLFSSTLLPEHQNLDLPLPEPNLPLTTNPETKLDSTIKATKPNTPNPTFSSNILNCNGCVVQEMKSSTELQTVADDRKADATNSVIQTNIPINVIDTSPDSIQLFCLNFVQSLRKSPRVEDELAEIGSGHFDAENNMEILKETDIGSGSFDVDMFESLRVTTPTVATLKTSQQQLGLLQRLWNIIPNFRSRNQRNLVNDDLEISGFPKNFSVQDCKDLFNNQIKSEFNTLQSIEKTTLSETKSISLFPPDNLISETENRSKSSVDFIEKTDAVKLDEITTMTASDLIVQFQNKPSAEELSSSIFQTISSFHDQIKTADKSEINIVPLKQTKSIDEVSEITSMPTPESFVPFQNKPSVSESTSNVFQTVSSFHNQIKTVDKSEMINIVPVKQTKSIGEVNEITSMPTSELFVPFQNKPSVIESTSNMFQNIPSVHDQSMITDKSDMVNLVPFKQTESVSNLEKITVTDEGFSLKVEDSVEQPKVSRPTVIDLITTSTTASPFIESLIGLSTESSISLNVQRPNIISSEIPEDLKIIPSERLIQGDKKIFFSDLNNDDILELGSSDERIISDKFTTMDKIELKEVTRDQNTFISERRFIPNFFSGGSGARELPESFISTDTNMIKNELSLSNTNAQSVFDNPFLEEGNALKTTVDLIQASMIDEERRFIPNFFSAGSGARELPEFDVSSDVTSYEKEIALTGANVQSVTGSLFLEEEKYSAKTVNFMQTPMTNDGRRFIPNFFSEGSGARELQELYNTTVSGGLFVEELSEKEISKNYILIDNHNEFSSLEPFDVGSGERKLDEVTIDTKNLNNYLDNVSPPESMTSSSDGLINEKIFTKFNTDPPVNREMFMNDTGSVEFVDPKKDNSDQNLIFKSGERTEYSLTTRKPCINCSNVSLEKSKSEVFLTAKETPSENKQPKNETEVAQAVISFSRDSGVASSTFSNPNKKGPIFVNLLTEIDAGTQNKNEVYLEPEPEMSVQSFKPTEPSRRVELNDDPPTDSLYFFSKPEATDVSLKSKTTDSVIVDSLRDDPDPINVDKMNLKPEPGISPNPLTRRRGARFDISPTDMPGFTSKQETTVSDVRVSVQPTPSVNLFQSRRGARGHDLFDLEKLDSEATVFISKEETESSTSETVEETANSFTGVKIERAVDHTLIAEDEENGATKSTNLTKAFEALFTEIPRNKSEPFTTLFSDNSSMTDSIPPSTKEMELMEVNLNPDIPLPSLKFCQSASECNVSLNERCMPKDDTLICNCGKAFRRNLKTKKCEATITLQTSLTLPGERFYEDLRDINTQLYKQKKRDYIKIMWYLLRHNPKLFHTVAEVDIASFEEGSLIVNYTLKLLDNGNETASELAQQLQEDLSKLINEQEQLNNASFEFKNASVSTLVLNPCLSSDMNYCHKNALCIQTEEKGFKCQCKADYLDNSGDKRYPGENCTGFCDDNYCGDHGKCYLKDQKQKQCRCDGWYLGERCEINGIVVIASFAFASFLIIAVVVLFVFYCKRNRNRKFYNRNFQPGQEPPAGDSLELEQATQHCRMSKFLAVSTPLYEAPNPTIQVTSPSFTGSSIDYDSTFDRTPYDSEASNESGIAPKV